VRAGKGILALLAALLAASPVLSDYKDSYSRGLEAAKDGDWAAVRQRMQEAIQDNPTAAQRVRLYGQRWEPYVPQFYLGLAAFKQGDCSTALAQWRSSANSGVIASVPNLKAEQDRNAAACDTRVAQQPKPEPPKTEPRTDTGTGTTAPTTPDGGREPPKQPPKTEPPRTEPPKTEPPRTEPPKAPPKPVETPLAQRVPAALLDAFRNYLGGRYAEVSRINPDSFSDARSRSQAYLIRAAARQIQAELDNSAAGLDAARADIRAVRAASPSLVPDPALFSPRFRSLYSATR